MIFKFEEKALKWVCDNIVYIALGLVVIFTLVIRYGMRDWSNSDMEVCLVPWYTEIKEYGGLSGIGHPITDCNYNLPYLFLVAIFTYIPVNPVYLFKGLSGIFDYASACAVAYLVYMIVPEDKDKQLKAAIALIIALMNPIALLNSAGWGQCDSMYTFFAVMALIFLIKENYIPSFVFLGLSFCFKLQAVFILPLFAFYYVYKRRFSLLYFVIVPVVMEICSIPAIIAGRGVLDVFRIYLGQTDWFPRLSMSYPCFWGILNDASVYEGYDELKNIAILTAVTVLGCFMVFWIKKGIELNARNLAYMAYICVFTCVLFLPGMHDRYGYMYEILMLALVFTSVKLVPVAVGLLAITLTSYGSYLFEQYANFTMLSWFNTIAYVASMIIITRIMLKEKE